MAKAKAVKLISFSLPNKVGQLAKAGINITSSWATAFTGKTASCILMTAINRKK
jgi:hypothetical protein